MAKLRRLGGALTGVAESLNRIVPILLQDKLRRQQAIEEDVRTSARQRETALRGAELGMLPKLMAGEIGPDAFSADIQGALPLEAMRPSPEKLLSGLMDELGGASDLSKLGSAGVLRARAGQRLSRAGYDPLGEQGSLSQFQTIQSPSVDGSLPSTSFLPVARPEIESLMASREAQKQSIVDELNRVHDETLALERGKALESRRGTEQAEAEAFGAKLNRDTFAAQNANQLDLAKTTALGPIEAENARLKAEATLPTELRKARETARIQQQYGEWSPDMMQRRLQFEKDKAIQAMGLNRQEDVLKMADGISAIQQPLAELAQLSKDVNTSDFPQPMRAAGSYTQLDQKAYALDSKARALAMQVVNVMGYNKGATSENDVNSILQLFPTSYNARVPAEAKIADFNKRIHTAYAALVNAPPGLDPLSRINVTRSMLGLPLWTAQDFQGGVPPAPLAANPRDSAQRALEAARQGQ